MFDEVVEQALIDQDLETVEFELDVSVLETFNYSEVA